MNEDSGDAKRSIPERSAQTILLMDALRKLANPGDFVPYASLSAVCGRNVQKEGRCYLASAVRALLHEEGLLYVTVYAQGIKRGGAGVALDCGRQSVAKIHREGRRGIKKMGSADLSKLDNEGRVAFNAVGAALGALSLVSQSRSVEKLRLACATEQRKLELKETLQQFGG